jgi:hypothetical protein
METPPIKSDYETMIFTFRGKKVMIDSDLALLYDVPTKALKQQVKRNQRRFPEDFMFELSKNEKDELVTICDRLHSMKHSSVDINRVNRENESGIERMRFERKFVTHDT